MSATVETIPIRTGSKGTVTGLFHPPAGAAAIRAASVILAHGAGSDLFHPFLIEVATGLSARGIGVLRFNFPYREQGRKAPDRMPVLLDTWNAAWNACREHCAGAESPLFAAGKSMGGRAAAHAVSAGLFRPTGLVFLGYPLHSPGKPEVLRDAPLYDLREPLLFVTGTRDRLCDLEKLQGVLARLEQRARLQIVEGGDHSFRVRKADRRTDEEVRDDITRWVADWIEGVVAGAENGAD